MSGPINDPINATKLQRGRALTREEITSAIADRQTAIRHGTADVSWEIAEQLLGALSASESLRAYEPLEVSELVEIASRDAPQGSWYSTMTEIVSNPPGLGDPSYEVTTLYFNQPGTRESIGTIDVRFSQPTARLIRVVERVTFSEMAQWHKVRWIVGVCRGREIPVE